MLTLAEWIKELGGAAKAATAIKENRRTIQAWLYSEKMPKPATAQRLISLSKGKLDFNSLYAPLFARLAEKQAKALIKKGVASE